MSRFVELAFNLPVKKLFTYEVPEGSAAPIGVRVSVPFGSRSLTGMVVAERTEPPAGVEVKQVKRVVDSRPLFDAKVIALAGWMARMYMCSLGEALSAMIPTGIPRPLSTTVTELSLRTVTLISLQWPASASSTELSTTS